MNASAGGAVTTMKKGENTVRYDIVMVTYNSMKSVSYTHLTLPTT